MLTGQSKGQNKDFFGPNLPLNRSAKAPSLYFVKQYHSISRI